LIVSAFSVQRLRRDVEASSRGMIRILSGGWPIILTGGDIVANAAARLRITSSA
jgi:hypothetical protein